MLCYLHGSTNFTFFFKQKFSAVGSYILLELLQPEVCPLSERLVRGEQQRWLLAPCSRWWRQTRVSSKENILCYETDAVWPVRTCWVCPGPAPGEQQLCSVVGLGF